MIYLVNYAAILTVFYYMNNHGLTIWRSPRFALDKSGNDITNDVFYNNPWRAMVILW